MRGTRKVPKTFSEFQIKQWRRYERVRTAGRYNMVDPRARLVTRLNSEDFLFILQNYSALKSAAESS